MQIQQGVVRYKDRTDLICNYGITDDGKQYYFLDDKPLPNGNIIASTALVEAVDPSVKATHAGVITKEGQIVIPLENKMVKNLGNNILLVERATPVSETVLESIGLKNIPDAATKLVTTPAAIKDRLMVKMQNEGRFVFNDQFSEATIFDYDGKNLINNEYFSFIGMNSKNIYFSKNTVDSEIVEYSIFPEKVAMEDDNKDKINVEEVAKNNEEQIAQTINGQMTPPVVAEAANNMPGSVGQDQLEGKHIAAGNVPDVPPIPVVPTPPAMPTPSAQPMPTGVVPDVPQDQTASSIPSDDSPIIPVASDMKEESTPLEQAFTATPADAQTTIPNEASSVVAETSIVPEEAPVEAGTVVPSDAESTVAETSVVPEEAPVEAGTVAPSDVESTVAETSVVPEEAPVEAEAVAPSDAESTVTEVPAVPEETPVEAEAVAPSDAESAVTEVPAVPEEVPVEAEAVAPSDVESAVTETPAIPEETSVEATPIAPDEVEDTVMANTKENDSSNDLPPLDTQIPIVDDNIEIPVIPEVNIEEDNDTEETPSEEVIPESEIVEDTTEVEEPSNDSDNDTNADIEKEEVPPEKEIEEEPVNEKVEETSQVLDDSDIFATKKRNSDEEITRVEETDDIIEEDEDTLDDLEEKSNDRHILENRHKAFDVFGDFDEELDVSLHEEDEYERDSRDDLMNDRFRRSFEDRDDDFSDRDLFGDSLLNLDSINMDYDDKKTKSNDMNIIDDITKSMANLISLNKKQSNKIVDYEKAVAKLRRSGNEISKKNRSLEDEIRFLNGKVRNYETIVSKLENRNRELDDRIQEQNKRLKDQEEEIQSLKPSASSKEELLKLIADANSLLDDDMGFRRTA